ncbi:MAG: YraN family protein [Campylobacterales bacterium]
MSSPKQHGSNHLPSLSTSRSKGSAAEDEAVAWLESRGFEIVERNFIAKRFGEIDIITRQAGVWRFVEVKSGQGFEPLQNMTRAKIGKLLRSVEFYLKVHHITAPFCLDLIVVRDGEIDYLPNITFDL